ncbi:MAG: YbaK/EbsC family protein [Phototrophicaceae bacterium]
MPKHPLTPQHVQAVLDSLGLKTQIIFFEETTATSQQAADQIGCQLGQIVKSIAFMVDGQPVLVLTSGDQKVDDRKLARHFGVGRKKVKTAKAEELVEIFGYEPGSVPPVGHRVVGIPILIDATLQRFETLYAAGGAHNAIFAVGYSILVHKTKGLVMDVVEENELSEAMQMIADMTDEDQALE